MKRLMKALFILALVLCFAMPVFAIKILPYNVPLQDLMKWDKYGATLRLSNPEGETLSVGWTSTVDLWNYDGSTWTYNLPAGDTFAFGKGVAITGAFSVTGAVTIAGDVGITGDILMATTSKIQFHDTGLYINASGDGALVISSDGTIAVGGTTSYTLTSPAVKFIATTSVVHEYDAASYVTQTVTNAGLVTVTVTGDSAGSYEIVTDDTTIVLDAATAVSLEAGAGTYGFSATTFDVGALTITNVGTITTTNAAGPTVINLAATATVPTLCPNQAEVDTGIGWQSDVLHVVLGGVDEYNFGGTAFITSASDGAALGTATYMWSDLFLASEAVINFNAGNFTITHSAGLLTLNGAVTVGASAAGAAVTFYGDIANSSCVWDETANTLKLFTTYTADAQIETYDARIDATTTYNTAITTGKFAQGIYIGVGGTGNVDSGGSLFPLWIDSSGTGTNSGTYYMARFSVQSGGLLPNTYIQFQTASPGVEYLFALDGNVAPYATGGTDCTASGATDPKGTIAVRLPDGNAGYIRVWTAK